VTEIGVACVRVSCAKRSLNPARKAIAARKYRVLIGESVGPEMSRRSPVMKT
jgi:hypothetical protein